MFVQRCIVVKDGSVRERHFPNNLISPFDFMLNIFLKRRESDCLVKTRLTLKYRNTNIVTGLSCVSHELLRKLNIYLL